jgi:hypothetical protein
MNRCLWLPSALALAILPAAQLVPNGPGAGVGTLPAKIAVHDTNGELLYWLASTTENVEGLVDAGHAVLERGGQTWAVAPSGIVAPGGPVYITTWTNVDGTTSTVITRKLKSESPSNHAWRHGASVKALLKKGPGPVTEFAGPAAKHAGQAPQASGTMSTSWQSALPSGALLSHTVTTEPKAGETPTEQAERHYDAVQALMAVFSPAVPKTSALLIFPVTRAA